MIIVNKPPSRRLLATNSSLADTLEQLQQAFAASQNLNPSDILCALDTISSPGEVQTAINVKCLVTLPPGHAAVHVEDLGLLQGNSSADSSWAVQADLTTSAVPSFQHQFEILGAQNAKKLDTINTSFAASIARGFTCDIQLEQLRNTSHPSSTVYALSVLLTLALLGLLVILLLVLYQRKRPKRQFEKAVELQSYHVKVDVDGLKRSKSEAVFFGELKEKDRGDERDEDFFFGDDAEDGKDNQPRGSRADKAPAHLADIARLKQIIQEQDVAKQEAKSEHKKEMANMLKEFGQIKETYRVKYEGPLVEEQERRKKLELSFEKLQLDYESLRNVTSSGMLPPRPSQDDSDQAQKRMETQYSKLAKKEKELEEREQRLEAAERGQRLEGGSEHEVLVQQLQELNEHYQVLKSKQASQKAIVDEKGAQQLKLLDTIKNLNVAMEGSSKRELEWQEQSKRLKALLDESVKNENQLIGQLEDLQTLREENERLRGSVTRLSAAANYSIVAKKEDGQAKRNLHLNLDFSPENTPAHSSQVQYPTNSRANKEAIKVWKERDKEVASSSASPTGRRFKSAGTKEKVAD